MQQWVYSYISTIGLTHKCFNIRPCPHIDSDSKDFASSVCCSWEAIAQLAIENFQTCALQAESSHDPFAWLYLTGCYLVGRNKPFQDAFKLSENKAGVEPVWLHAPADGKVSFAKLRDEVERRVKAMLDGATSKRGSHLVCICDRVHAMIAIPSKHCVFEDAYVKIGNSSRLHQSCYFRQDQADVPEPFGRRTFLVDRTLTSRVLGLAEPVLSSRLLPLPGFKLSLTGRKNGDAARPDRLSGVLTLGSRKLMSWVSLIASTGEPEDEQYFQADELLKDIALKIARMKIWNSEKVTEILDQTLDNARTKDFYAQFLSLLEGLRDQSVPEAFNRELISIRSRLWDSMLIGNQARLFLDEWFADFGGMEDDIEKSGLNRKAKDAVYRAAKPESLLSVSEYFWPTHIQVESVEEKYCHLQISGRTNAVCLSRERFVEAFQTQPVVNDRFWAEVNLQAEHPTRLMFINVKSLGVEAVEALRR